MPSSANATTSQITVNSTLPVNGTNEKAESGTNWDLITFLIIIFIVIGIIVGCGFGIQKIHKQYHLVDGKFVKREPAPDGLIEGGENFRSIERLGSPDLGSQRQPEMRI